MCKEQCNCEKQKHVHELTGSTKIFKECDECHNHRFCTVSGEAIYTKDKKDHFHEFYGKTFGAIDVGNGKHVHFLKDFAKEEDGHKHEFQVAPLIDSPIDFKYK